MEITDLQRALDYIEEHLTEPLDFEELSKRAYASRYHFQRLFGILCGVTPGEYVRRRRLSRAALDLQEGEKALDVALKYGYETGESFSRAFLKFHGIPPAQAKKGAPIKNFPRLDPNVGAATPPCKIAELPAKTLVGFKARFRGAPFGEERARQEHEFYSATRGKQWLLLGAAGGKAEEYAVIANVGEGGYDYSIAYELDELPREMLFDPAVAGIDAERMGFETIRLERRRAALFQTPKSVHPIADYAALRAAVGEMMKSADFELADAPELVVYHWHLPQKEERFLEICLPVR